MSLRACRVSRPPRLPRQPRRMPMRTLSYTPTIWLSSSAWLIAWEMNRSRWLHRRPLSRYDGALLPAPSIPHSTGGVGHYTRQLTSPMRLKGLNDQIRARRSEERSANLNWHQSVFVIFLMANVIGLSRPIRRGSGPLPKRSPSRDAELAKLYALHGPTFLRLVMKYAFGKSAGARELRHLIRESRRLWRAYDRKGQDSGRSF